MYHKREAVVFYFGFVSIMWGLMPLWLLIWQGPLFMVYGWFGLAAGLMFTAGIWYDLTCRGCSVWKTGLALGLIICVSGSIGQVYVATSWWGAFGLLFVTDILAWLLVSQESK